MPKTSYPVSFKENSFNLFASSISVAAAPGIIRLSLHIDWYKKQQSDKITKQEKNKYLFQNNAKR